MAGRVRLLPVVPRVMRSSWERLALRYRSQLTVGAIIAAVVLLLCGVLFGVVEGRHNESVRGVSGGLRWVTLTLLTQSSPDDITTSSGEVLYYLVLLVGVGLVAMATGAIASKLVQYLIRKDSGMRASTDSNHIVICGWSAKGHEILRELHADEVEDRRRVVILADLEMSPTDDPLVTFVRGSAVSDVDLRRAGIERADTAIVLADHSKPGSEGDDMDARTLLTTLAVETANPDCYTCVEVIRSENRIHFQRTKADELVVSAELTGALLASSAVTHGLSRLVTDLVTHPEGNEFYGVQVPASLDGRRFDELLLELKRQHNCVVVAVGTGDSEYELNPPADHRVSVGERLLVVAERGVHIA